MSENKSKTQLKLTAKTNVGKVRDHNEDNYVVCPDIQNREWFFSDKLIEPVEGTLLVIADGMGGLNAGEIASSIAIDTVQQYFNSTECKKIETHEDVRGALLQCINDAQTNMLAHARNHTDTKGMGTTIIIAFIKDNILHTAWVGDSRCYVFRNNTELYFASKDHSLVQELVDAGEITMEQAFYHPESNIITRSLGDNFNKTSKPDFCSFPLEDGDKILLCSDGLNGMLKDDTIATLLHNNTDINEAGNALITSANEAGGHDNITLVLCDILSTKKPIQDAAIKLYQLNLAVKFGANGKTTSPFDTLRPLGKGEVETSKSKKNRIKKTFLTALLVLTIIIITALILFPPSAGNDKKINKPNVNFKEDSVNSILEKKLTEETIIQNEKDRGVYENERQIPTPKKLLIIESQPTKDAENKEPDLNITPISPGESNNEINNGNINQETPKTEKTINPTVTNKNPENSTLIKPADIKKTISKPPKGDVKNGSKENKQKNDSKQPVGQPIITPINKAEKDSDENR